MRLFSNPVTYVHLLYFHKYNWHKCLISLKEILQNADDAQATEVKFFIDERSHGQGNLLHPSLAKFQGPSLLAYNDAVFTDEDWTNIQKLKRSDKRSDPFKIGKFGVGFNSVFHLTGTNSSAMYV